LHDEILITDDECWDDIDKFTAIALSWEHLEICGHSSKSQILWILRCPQKLYSLICDWQLSCTLSFH